VCVRETVTCTCARHDVHSCQVFHINFDQSQSCMFYDRMWMHKPCNQAHLQGSSHMQNLYFLAFQCMCARKLSELAHA
jgi:hypothetical protein